MGHTTSKINSKTGICATNNACSIKAKQQEHTIIEIDDAQDELIDIIISDENVVVYNKKLFYFILNKNDKDDRSFLKPFLKIICDCKLEDTYMEESVKNAYKVFCLGISHRLYCKYLAFAALKIESFYCIDSIRKQKRVGVIKTICAFKPFSQKYFKEMRKARGIDAKDLEQEVKKKLNPSFGAFIMLKVLQYLYDVEKIEIAILEAISHKVVNVYKKWGFQLGLGPLYNYATNENEYSKEYIQNAILSHQKNTESVKFKMMSSLKFDAKLKEDCTDIFTTAGYRMWIRCDPESLQTLRDYVSKKFDSIPLLTKYDDSMNYIKVPKNCPDDEFEPDLYD